VSDQVRVRFAPSPTGELHLGNVRTALYNWLFAKRHGGVFVLRIEDTDRERSTEASCRSLMEVLRWLGLSWDEGPEAGGPHAPYRQSERGNIYREHLERLKSSGAVYPCFCTEEELDIERKRQQGRGEMPRYGGKCRVLAPSEAASRVAAGDPHVLRFRVPKEEIVFTDEVRGEVRFPEDQIGDFVLTRTDGSPTYNFTVVVDDALMGITHVLRGEDHLSNTPKQIIIYRTLGYAPPRFAHLSLLKGPDGQKLSKRHGETAVEGYRALGYLPEAFLNYIALLGFAPQNGEIQTLEALAAEFDLKRVHKSGAIFDPKKLHWMGNQYIMRTPTPDLARAVKPFLVDAGLSTREDLERRKEWLEGIVDAVKTHLGCLSEVVDQVRLFFETEPAIAGSQAEELRSAGQVLSVVAKAIEAAPAFDGASFGAAVKAAGQELNVKGRALYHPVRLALTGREDGPELVKIAPLLGRETVLKRLRAWA